MAGICFYFERYDIDVWSGRDIDLDAWNYACKAAGDIDKAVVINRTSKKLKSFDTSMEFEVVDELPHLPGRVVYVCCPWDDVDNRVSLWNFEHNVDWYVFGPANGWRKKIDSGIYVPQNGLAALHSTHIASTVLLHRYKTLMENS